MPHTITVEKQLEMERRLTTLEQTDKRIEEKVGLVASELADFKSEFSLYKTESNNRWDKFTDSVTQTLNGITSKITYALGALAVIGFVIYVVKDVVLKKILG